MPSKRSKPGLKQAAKTTEELAKQTARVVKAIRKAVSKKGKPNAQPKKNASTSNRTATGKSKSLGNKNAKSVSKAKGKTASQKAKKRAAQKSTRKKVDKRQANAIYTVSELPLTKKPNTLFGQLRQIRKDKKKIEALKPPGAMWTAIFNGNFMMGQYQDFDQLIDAFERRYADAVNWVDGHPERFEEWKREHGADILGGIGWTTFAEPVKPEGEMTEADARAETQAAESREYQKMREQTKGERKRKVGGLLDIGKKVFGLKEEKRKPGEFFVPKNQTDRLVDLLEASIGEIAKLKADIEKLKVGKPKGGKKRGTAKKSSGKKTAGSQGASKIKKGSKVAKPKSSRANGRGNRAGSKRNVSGVARINKGTGKGSGKKQSSGRKVAKPKRKGKK